MDEIDEYVARARLRCCRLRKQLQVVGSVTFRPGLGAAGPGVELAWGVGSGKRVVASLQPRIDNVSGKVGDVRPALGIDIGDGNARVARELGETRNGEARVANLDHVVELASVELARQQIDELAKVVLVETLEGCELPEDWSKPVAELCQPRLEKAIDEVAGFGEHLLLGDEARAFDREHKAVRRGRPPNAEALRALQAIMGGVDLDRGELARCVAELVSLLQALRIKDPAPRCIAPAADADADSA